MKIKNKIIKENHEENGYMFINSLKVIKKQVDEMLEMVKSADSGELIRNMVHEKEWIQSLIASSQNDINQVYNEVSDDEDEKNLNDYIEKKEREFDSYDPEYVNKQGINIQGINENISKIKKFMGLSDSTSKKKNRRFN